jgi:hypothetical protein
MKMAEMDMKEKLVELLDDIQLCGEDFTDYEIYGMRLPDTVSNEDVADHLIANGVTVQEWISVKDRLPENEKCVLVYSQDGGVAEGKYNARFNEWVQFRWNVTELKNVTHWMPLPEPPKEVE